MSDSNAAQTIFVQVIPAPPVVCVVDVITPALGGGIADAPLDGNVYGRKDGAWVQVDSAPLAARVMIADGAQSIALPAYAPLTFSGVNGTLVSLLDATGLQVNSETTAVVQFEITVLNKKGNSVVLAYSLDEGAVTELGRMVLDSTTAIPVTTRYDVSMHMGQVLRLFISSDASYAGFAWSAGEVFFFPTSSEGAAAS